MAKFETPNLTPDVLEKIYAGKLADLDKLHAQARSPEARRKIEAKMSELSAQLASVREEMKVVGLAERRLEKEWDEAERLMGPANDDE